MINPESPAERNTLVLQARIDPPVPQLLWHIDGQPYRLAGPPYAVQWPLDRGVHPFQVRLPYGDEVSRPIRITVQ